MKKLFVILIFVVVSNASFAANVKGFYTFTMTVERNGEEVESGIEMVKAETKFCQGLYADTINILGFSWFILPTHLFVGIKNYGNRSIKLIWDESAYISTKNRSCKVFHSGVDPSDRDKEQLPSTIVRGATFKDIIIPTANVSHSPILNDWEYYYLLDFNNGGQDGEVIKVMLTLKDGDETIEYIFAFHLKYNKAKIKTYFNDGLCYYKQ